MRSATNIYRKIVLCVLIASRTNAQSIQWKIIERQDQYKLLSGSNNLPSTTYNQNTKKTHEIKSVVFSIQRDYKLSVGKCIGVYERWENNPTFQYSRVNIWFE